MKNEIGRKLTSLTLLSILLASGVTFGLPGAIPTAEASHNANLFVSTESSQFNNYFAGPQVIEVVVNDNDIKTLDDVHGEPDVTVNGKKLRMAQATDGNWYGYFASRAQAQAADSTQGSAATAPGFGLDFGNFCSSTTSALGVPVANALFTDTVGVAVNKVVTGAAGTNGNTAFAACTSASSANTAIQNVVRENKTLNSNSALGGKTGQIGINTDAWPVISLYDFSAGGNVIIIYNKGGGTQTTTLTFDTIPSNLINTSFDRTSYPLGAQVHVTMTDPQLNIDPTDEDSWSWDTNTTNNRVYYQLFDENGAAQATTSTQAQNLIGNLTTFMFEKNGKLTVDLAAQGQTVGFFNDNDDEVFGTALSLTGGALGSTSGQLMTFTESGPKTGIFGNYDESDNANLDICSSQQSSTLCPSFSSNAVRGKSAVIGYNDVSNSAVVGYGFGTLDTNAPDGEWNSGEEISVTLVDTDANRNSRSDEDLDVFDPSVPLIPTLKIGTPFTLENGADFAIVARLSAVNGDNGSARFTASTTASGSLTMRDLGAITASPVQSFSQRAILNFTFPDFNGGSGSGASSNSTFLVKNSGSLSGAALQSADSALVIDLQACSNTACTTQTQRKLSDLQASLVDVIHTGVSSTQNRGINLFNYDIRSLNNTGGITNVDVYLLINTTKAATTSTNFVIATEGDASTEGKITSTTGFGSAAETGNIRAVSLANRTTTSGIVSLNSSSAIAKNILNNVFARTSATDNNNAIGLMFLFNQTGNFTISTTANKPIVADFFSVGLRGDGTAHSDRFNNAIYRFELEETGDNTSTFIGSAEYTMLNQLNIFTAATYTGLGTIDDEVTFIVHEDLDDEDAPRINYLDLGSDGVSTQIADQEDAGTHSGVVSFDHDSYKVADTVTITLEDQDLNVDSDLIDIFTTAAASGSDSAGDAVGTLGLGTYINGDSFGSLLDITFDDQRWVSGTTNTGTACTAGTGDDGLASTGFTLIETGIATGVFKGDFQIPSDYCDNTGTGAGTRFSTTGTDLEVNYNDFRDASGEVIQVGDGAGVRANTGSISLDRTVYPVPFGQLSDFSAVSTTGTGDSTPNGLSVFPIHATGIGSGNLNANDETIGVGNLNVIIRVNDPDFDVSAAGEDKIQSNTTGSNPRGPVKISVSRGSESVVLGYAGGPAILNGPIGVGSFNATQVRQLGPMTEIAPAAGIFELPSDFIVRYTDGPDDANCPATTVFTNIIGTSTTTETSRFSTAHGTGQNYCIIQGDILTVEYTDPTDASGDINTVTDSATFDLRNGVLQSDKSVYIIGSDMILTLIEPDFDLDSDAAESYNLDLIEWDSDAATITMGVKGGTTSSNGASFDPEPNAFRETGDNTGIFQVVIEIPDTLGTERLDRGEEIQLEYTDWSPSGADFVGDEDEDINLTIYTSNFGATVELDQKVYTWTDKVFITVVAPDHNFDSNLIDTIGDTAKDTITVATRGHKLNNYHLVETGTDTGIFTGEVILTGFSFDADGDSTTGTSGVDTNPRTGNAAGSNPNNRGPTDGFLEADDDDGLTVSFEFTEDETVVGSALVRWNIGEVQFLEASYPATGQGVVRVVDPDLNLNPESVDNFDIDAWSDSDAGGIDLTVTETNEATGIFEGTIFFTVTDESSGHRLRVAEGDTVTAEYEDNTLPSPYTTADELEIDATTFIGSIVPPLERAPASNPRVVDAFGNELDEVNVDQQVQITADLANGQDKDQPFAYLVQIQDENGVTVSLSWITGSLAPGQSLNPAQSWTPSAAGTYNVQTFVWESVDNPDALSPTVETTITVV